MNSMQNKAPGIVVQDPLSGADLPTLLSSAPAPPLFLSPPFAQLCSVCVPPLPVDLYVRRTKTPVPFFMPYTDATKDIDVSAQMAAGALIEPGLTWVWHKLLKEGCTADAAEPGMVVDVGANFG